MLAIATLMHLGSNWGPGSHKKMRQLHFAGDREPIFRFVAPQPVDGGSPCAGNFWRPSLLTCDGRRPAGFAELKLVLFFTNLLTIALACQRFFYALLFTWFQIKRVTFNFLDDVFGLHLALKAPQGILKGFAFLYSNLCQEKYTSKQSQSGYLPEYSRLMQELHKTLVIAGSRGKANSKMDLWTYDPA